MKRYSIFLLFPLLLFSCIDVVFDEEILDESSDEEQPLTLVISQTEWDPSDDSYLYYDEDGCSEWHIPTKEEASLLREQYGGANLTATNQKLLQSGGDTLSLDYRYYCEDMTYTFSFKDGTVISKAGANTKNYRIRIVRCVE